MPSHDETDGGDSRASKPPGELDERQRLYLRRHGRFRLLRQPARTQARRGKAERPRLRLERRRRPSDVRRVRTGRHPGYRRLPPGLRGGRGRLPLRRAGPAGQGQRTVLVGQPRRHAKHSTGRRRVRCPQGRVHLIERGFRRAQGVPDHGGDPPLPRGRLRIRQARRRSALPRVRAPRARRQHRPAQDHHGPRPARHHADRLRVDRPGAQRVRPRPRRQSLPVRPFR